jgi:hypothetical protein
MVSTAESTSSFTGVDTVNLHCLTMRMLDVRRASNRSDCISCDLKSADPAGCQGRHALLPSSAHITVTV